MTPAQHRAGWRATLIGVSRYADSDFPDIPAAVNNVADLAELLTAPTGTALAAYHCTVLTNPEHHAEVGAAVASAARDADDVLLVYFAGHGVVDRRGRLFLGLSGTSRDHPAWSSVPFATLRDELSESRARTRILILDCCFSGRAFEAMGTASALVDGQIDIKGTYTIASSSRNEPSIAPEGNRHTAFTAALLSTAADSGLTLDQLYREVDHALHRGGYPRPQRRTVDGAGELRLFTPPDFQASAAVAVPLARSPDKVGVEIDALVDDGRSAADRGDLIRAEDSWRRAASQGHTDAMVNLAGLLDAQGRIQEAHTWYRTAADRGDIEAMGQLAILLYHVKRTADAEVWWRRAAESGVTDAMYNLAVLLDKSRRLDDALAWYRRAAEAGNPDAMHNLAIRLRYRGQLVEAATWWQRAGHREAQRTSEKLRSVNTRKRLPEHGKQARRR